MDIPRAVYFINFSSLKVGFFPFEDFAVFKYEVFKYEAIRGAEIHLLLSLVWELLVYV